MIVVNIFGYVMAYIGRVFLGLISEIGKMGIFLFNTLAYSVLPPYRWKPLLRQIWFQGYMSLIVIFMTGSFAGMVLALQFYHTLKQFGADSMLGPAVALSLIRELGPVFTALMVTGRAGSAITSEIGIMRISEQIDSLYVMALNPYKYVIVPNFLAAILCFPLLTALFDVIGIYGGYFVGVKLLGVSGELYFEQMKSIVNMEDIAMGFYKSLCFAIIVIWICCYKGFMVGTEFGGHGARAVSKATTDAVVMSSVTILIGDYIMGSFFI
ncbi:MAG: MlaE family lipid ABC transporter permease subunit [Candidatus Magnetoovum sp. WYHC-5]|nr:MlaE family lipid ABC transporter permease subunit [Candidatus Magnetoovum sp. WYHC-5]